MAEVFLARAQNAALTAPYTAVKRILPHLLDDRSFVGMFQDEARLAAQLDHPNIVHIHEVGKVEEQFYIAMEYLRGIHAGDLCEFATHTPIPLPLVARIGVEACAGLQG